MSSTKCRKCGLVNSYSDVECRRCRAALIVSEKGPAPVRKVEGRRLSVFPLLAVAVAAAAGWFIFGGKSEKPAPPVAVNVAPAPAQSEYQAPKGAYFDGVRNSNGLRQADGHTEQINNLMQAGGSNSAAK